jgi:hypothetical protein
MATDIKEPAQLCIRASHQDKWLAGHIDREIPARFIHLVHTPGMLPGVDEHGLPLQFIDAFVGVPRRRNCRGLRERELRVVAPDDLSE